MKIENETLKFFLDREANHLDQIGQLKNELAQTKLRLDQEVQAHAATKGLKRS